MSQSFSLDDIRAAAEAQYGHTEVAGATLQNVMRLSREKRIEFSKMREKLDEAEDASDVLEEMLRMVAVPGKAIDDLIEACAGDLGMLMTVFTRYSEGTQVGEA